jgi:hypothetical protein
MENIPTHKQLRKLLHCLLDEGKTFDDLGHVADALKYECARRGFTYGTPPADVRGIFKAIDAVLARRPVRFSQEQRDDEL